MRNSAKIIFAKIPKSNVFDLIKNLNRLFFSHIRVFGNLESFLEQFQQFLFKEAFLSIDSVNFTCCLSVHKVFAKHRANKQQNANKHHKMVDFSPKKKLDINEKYVKEQICREKMQEKKRIGDC